MAPSGVRLFGVIDTARDRRLFDLVSASPQHRCLFAGTLDYELARVAPYLVVIEPDSRLWSVWQSEGWGQSWGIACRSAAPFELLWRHLRRFLQAQLPDGEVVFFRFFDPRVWRIYLPNCEPEDLARWFANVTDFLAETEAGDGTLSYSLSAGALMTRALPRP